MPGFQGPYPGPFFTLSYAGSLYRGRFLDDGVWVTEHGTRWSQLPAPDDNTARCSPEYARLRLGIIYDLMSARRKYTPQEVSVSLRNHPETDPGEVLILETSQDWEEANRRMRR